MIPIGFGKEWRIPYSPVIGSPNGPITSSVCIENWGFGNAKDHEDKNPSPPSLRGKIDISSEESSILKESWRDSHSNSDDRTSLNPEHAIRSFDIFHILLVFNTIFIQFWWFLIILSTYYQVIDNINNYNQIH